MPVRLTEALLDSLTPSDRDQFLFDAMLATFGYRLTPGGPGHLLRRQAPPHDWPSAAAQGD